MILKTHKISKLRVSDSSSKILFLVWSMPFLWIIGGERLLLPLIVIVLFLKSALHIRVMPKVYAFFFCFLLAYLLSLPQIRDPLRLITFCWDLSIYFGFLVILLEIYYYTPHEKFSLILRHLVCLFFVLNILALSYLYLGYWQYNTPIGYLIPGSLKSTSVASNIAIHNVGGKLWFLGIDYRLSSIFASGMQYAACLLLIIPINYHILSSSKSTEKIFFFFTLLVAILSLFFSQGRVAIFLGVLSLITSILLNKLVQTKLFSKSIIASLLITFFLFFLILISINWESINEIFSDIFVKRRSGSYEERMSVYVNSLDQIKFSPIFGYGTQIDFAGAEVPLGSHNWYLAVMFKHGITGFIPFMIFMILIIRHSIFSIFSFKRKDRKRRLAAILCICIISHSLLAFTAEPVVDAMHVYFLAIIYGISYSLYKNQLKN